MTAIDHITGRITRSRLRWATACALFLVAGLEFFSEVQAAEGAADTVAAASVEQSASVDEVVAPTAEAAAEAAAEADSARATETEAEALVQDAVPADAHDVTTLSGGSVRLGDRVRVRGDEHLPQAGFLFGDDIRVAGDVSDLFSLGDTITITGVVADNAFCLGDTVVLDGGRIEGDLHAAGDKIILRGEVKGDLYVAGDSLTLEPGSVVHGDVILAGADVDLDGTIKGRLRGAAGEVRISGEVGGDVNLRVGSLELQPGAMLQGSLNYEAADEAVIAETAQVLGAVRHDIRVVQHGDDDASDDEGGGLGLFGNLFFFTISLLVGFGTLVVARRGTLQAARQLQADPAASLGWGFVAACAVLLSSLALLVTIIASPIGLLGGLLLFAALFIARLVGALAMGDWILQRLRPQREPSPYLGLFIGLVLFYALTSVPILGFLAWFVVAFLGLGAMVLVGRGRCRRNPPPAPPQSGEMVAAV